MHRTLIIQVVVGLLIGGGLGALLGYYGKCSTGTCPLTANPYRGAFIGALMGGMLVFSAGGSRPDPEGNESGYSAGEIQTSEQFTQQVLNAETPKTG